MKRGTGILLRRALAFLLAASAIIWLLLGPGCPVRARQSETHANIEARLSALMAEINRKWNDHGQKLVTRVEVLPVDLDPPEPPPGFNVPPSARNVVIRDGIYYRDGRPTFLFGVEGRMYDGAWINRMLGLDLFCQHAGMVWWRSAMEVRESPGPRGGVKLTVSFRPYPWAGILVREALRGGTLWACDYYLVKRGDFNLFFKQYHFEPPFWTGVKDHDRGTGHFLDLHLENPEAMAYYTSMYRLVGQLLRPYPVFHHELVNEVRYNSYWVDNIVRFQEQMRRKYGTIEAANEAWGRQYGDFSEVIPPLSVDPGSFAWTGPEGERFPRNIWADWSAFMAEHAGEIFRQLRQEGERAFRGGYFTIQSPYVWGDRQMLPYVKVEAEDAYGHEAFFHPHPQDAPGRESWPVVWALMDQQLSNDLARNASPDRPIINLEAPFFVRPRYAGSLYGVKEYKGPAGPNAVRTFFWHQLVHGVSGSVISYFYTNERSDGGESVWDPRLMTREAVREIARVRAEMRDLAPVVMPRPRIRGKLGIVYSYETAREERGRPDFRKETMQAYAAAVLTGVPVDLVTARDIVAGKAARYPIVFLNHCIRFPREGLEKLVEYVRAGGTLIVSFNSLKYDDTVRPLDTEGLLGVAREQSLSGRPPTGELRALGLGEIDPAYSRMCSPHTGYRAELKGAEGIGSSPQGPPMSVFRLGEGRVYYLAWNLPHEVLRRALSWICRQVNVEPMVDVQLEDGIEADYVEAHLLGRETEGRYVVYALNFGGGPRTARLIPLPLARANQDRYLVREMRSGQYLSADGGHAREPWTAQDMARGIPSSLPPQNPELFLVEREDLAPLALRGLTAEQQEALAWAWRDSPPSKWRMLVDGYHVAEFRVSKPKMPTAVKALEDAGWEVNSLISRLGEEVETFSGNGITTEKLSGYQVLMLCGLRHGASVWRNEELAAVREFVRTGGGLFVCLKRDWHFDYPIYEDIQQFNIQDAGGSIYDPSSCILGEPIYVGFRDPSSHPTTEGVRLLQSTGMRPLTVEHPAAKTLFASAEDAKAMDLWGEMRDAPRAPVAVALEEGRGRVVVVSADTWLRPDELAMGDNERFLLNVVEWLGRRRGH